MSTAELRNIVFPALLTGLRGRNMPGIYGATDGLQLLGLTAQALRLERPASPESFIVDETSSDSRNVVPDHARPILLRLVGASSYVAAGGRTHCAIAEAMSLGAWKPHPFDLPHIESFVQKHASLLGTEALAFAQRDAAPEQRQSYFIVELMNDDNWTAGNRGEKAKYIARRRSEDPDAGLALMEAAWAEQDVESKVRLVSSLRVKSNAADVPFLRTLLKERSPRIKDAARALLARLPGYDGDNPNLREALSRIEARQRDGAKLELRLPPGVSRYGSEEWIVSTFTGFGISELAVAKGMTVDELVLAAVPDERLLCALMVSATNDARFDIISEISERHLPTMETFMASNAIPGVENLSADERVHWVRASFRPRHLIDISIGLLERLYDILEGPLPTDVARALLSSAVLRRTLLTPGQIGIDHYEMLAVLCPPELRTDLARMIHRDPHAASAVQFIELLHVLEK
ncbi:hypothetical protein G6L37_05625 [Agrobacterium rubi]|nr:hypothetical protein [Agrobacterium rubi]NTF24838.1 hypothetical protein [Agrobacterium rubi]